MEEQDDFIPIKSLCRDALAGNLKVDEFYSKWPKSADDNSFLQKVYTDVEDGIQHTPGHLLKGGIDFERWEKSDLYLRIYLDLSLLETGKPFTDLENLRERVIGLTLRSKSDVDRLLNSNPTLR
jgi:hypothetical protein